MTTGNDGNYTSSYKWYFAIALIWISGTKKDVIFLILLLYSSGIQCNICHCS